MNIQEALINIINNSPNMYAKAYAEAAKTMDSEHLKAQVPYILSNLSGWRGPLARETKAALKEIIS